MSDVTSVMTELKALPRKAGSNEIYLTALNPLLKKLKTNHELAISLWNTGDKAAKKVAVRIADAPLTDEKLLDSWVRDLDEWGITDAFTGHLVKYTPFAVSKAYEWAAFEGHEFIRRAGFALIAQMAWAKNEFEDQVFIDFLPFIKDAAEDNRYFVKKSVNWALRDIGKRNQTLNAHVIKLAKDLQSSKNKTAKWIATHRQNEFMSN